MPKIDIRVRLLDHHVELLDQIKDIAIFEVVSKEFQLGAREVDDKHRFSQHCEFIIVIFFCTNFGIELI
jgi:hypothetical protein